MLHTIRIASAAAFLSVAVAAALAHPGAAVARALDSADTTVTTTVTVAATASPRKHVASRIVELPTVTVIGHIHHHRDTTGSAADSMASAAEALPRKVGNAMPHVRFDMPFYSFGGSPRTSTASASE